MKIKMQTTLLQPERIFPNYEMKDSSKVLCDQVHPSHWGRNRASTMAAQGCARGTSWA